jgi:hypothetical protein
VPSGDAAARRRPGGGRSPTPASVYTKSCSLSSMRGECGRPQQECSMPGGVMTRLRRARYGKSRPVREERRVGALRILRRSTIRHQYMTPPSISAAVAARLEWGNSRRKGEITGLTLERREVQSAASAFGMEATFFDARGRTGRSRRAPAPRVLRGKWWSDFPSLGGSTRLDVPTFSDAQDYSSNARTTVKNANSFFAIHPHPATR